MICSDCHGRGSNLVTWPCLYNMVCTTCGGHGIIHCCEGEQSQACESEESQRQSASADRPTDRPSPIT